MSHPTELDFFNFIFERHLIWYKRFVLRQAPPWTDDTILQTYKIINVYRELDKCTLYYLDMMQKVTERSAQLLNTIFFRFFNRVNVYEELGIQPFNTINKKVALDLVHRFDVIRDSGGGIFNNAYLISSGNKGKKKHESVLLGIVETAKRIDHIIQAIDSSKTPQESFAILTTMPMVGPFLACEFWTDLTYLKFFKQGWTDNDFVNIGPGAKWGLELLFGKGLSKQELWNKLQYLHKQQEYFLPAIKQDYTWQDIAYTKAFSYYPFLSLTNIEGSLCEFRKYWNISHGKGRRKYFKPQIGK